MKRIEAGLHAHHAALAASDQEDMAAAAAVAAATPRTTSVLASGTSAPEDIHTPFAKINSVAPNSPAAEAGMQKGDYIKKFGPVNALNHDKLKKLTELVAANEGVSTSRSTFRKSSHRNSQLLTIHALPRTQSQCSCLAGKLDQRRTERSP
jgi:26S proteasome non-ATPase regulatory subunit 9